MSKLLAKIAAPLLIASNLFFAQPQKVEAENKSNFNLSFGGFAFSDKELDKFYSGFLGGGVGIDIKLNGDYLRWGADLSAFSKKMNKDGIENTLNLFQYTSTIQLISKHDQGGFYGEFGPIYVQVYGEASDGEEKAEVNVDAVGFIGRVGVEFFLGKNWGSFLEYSYNSALNGNLQLGGSSLSSGLKYYLDE